jgi:hypothetical protein
MPDSPTDEPPIGLELSLTRTAQADTALLPLEMSPAAHQPRREMLVLRQLNLQLSFEGRGALRKDIEDQPVTVEHARLEGNFQIAFLPGAQRLIDENQLCLGLLGAHGHLIDLPPADKKPWIGPLSARVHLGHHASPGRLGERAKFLSLIFEARPI